MDYSAVLSEAQAWAIKHHKESSIYKRSAFCNSVAYLVAGASGGFGGPSIREHLVSWSLAGNNGRIEAASIGGEAMTTVYPDGSIPMAGQWSIKDAIEHCEKICFSSITEYKNQALQILEREYCFDDDPTDMEALRGKSA